MYRMKKDYRASPNGIRVYNYEEGETYGPDTDPPMTKRLGDSLVSAGIAEDSSGSRKSHDPREEDKTVDPREQDKDEDDESQGDTESFDTEDLTVEEVLELVDSGEVSAEEALAAEKAGKSRRSLIRKLRR